MAVGQNGSPGAGHDREPRGPALAAASAAVVLFLAWAVPRLAPGLTFSPWTAALLGQTEIPAPPGPSRALAAAALALPLGAPAWKLSLASASAGALACGATAYLTASAAVRHVRAWTAAGAGFAAAILLGWSPVFEHLATQPGPGIVTAALALLSLGALAGARPGPVPAQRLAAAGALAGLAAANHASLLWLLPLYLAYGLTRRGQGLPAPAVTALLACSLTGAWLAAVAANWWAAGMRWSEYAAAGMRAPYPAPGRIGAARDILEPLAAFPAPLVLLLCAGAIPWAFSRRNGGVLALAGVTALTLGPLRPMLTNPAVPRFQHYDAAGPTLLFVALAWCGATCGLLCVTARLTSRRPGPWLRLAPVAAFAAGCGAFLLWNLPPARDDEAGRAADLMLASCPDGALILAGTPELAALLVSRAATGHRERGVTAAYVLDLLSQRGRRGMSADGRSAPQLEGAAHDDAQGQDWLGGRGGLMYRALHARPTLEQARLLDVAIWELLRQRAPEAPTCFVGVSADFVAARAKRAGSVLVYPPLPQTGGKRTWPAWETPRNRIRPAQAQAAAAVLVSLSNHARLTQRHEQAESLARLAIDTAPQSLPAQMALARAAARQGHADRARDLGAAYLRSMPPQLRLEETLEPLGRDLDAHAAAADWQALSGSALDIGANRSLYEATAGALWRYQELSLLRTGFARIVEGNPEDAWAHYEYGAALAELGELEAALDHALRASELAPRVVGNLFVDDGRYDLVREYQGLLFE